MIHFPKRIHGPLVIEHIGTADKREILIVGEDHGLNAACPGPTESTHFVDFITDFCKSHPDKKVWAIFEESYRGSIAECVVSKNKPSMLCELSRRIYSKSKGLPENFKLFFGDARFMHPFDMITMLYAHDQVVSNMYHGDQELQSTIDFATFSRQHFQKAKQFEKVLIRHTSHRVEMEALIKYLIFPGFKSAINLDWFKVYDNEKKNKNVLKSKLRLLRTRNKDAYRRLKQYVNTLLDKMLNNNDNYSAALETIGQRMNSASEHLEFEKSTGVNIFMTLLYSLAQDVYMLTHFLLNESANDNFVFVVGAVHSQNMSHFLNSYFQNRSVSRVYRSDGSGCIEMSPSRATPTPGPQAFLEFDQMRYATQYLKTQ